jgi:hypothetical protein
MITKPIRVTPQLAAQQRARGRPRLDVPNVRVECMVPREVYDKLLAAERAGLGYRTRVAANVLCNWANG